MKKIYVFLDTETTGLSAEKERMTEIAMVRTDEEFNIIDTYQTLINPEREITAKITELTGITESMVENESKYDEIIPVISEYYSQDSEEYQIIGVAHNMPFDQKFINKAGQDILGKDIITDFIDTVSLARELYPFWRNHKLETCAKKFNVMNENHHRAMNDTMVLYQIGKRLISEASESNIDPLNFRTKKKLHYKKGNN
jgi:DNA polymerase III subunit alpha, Gram-positive type